MRLMRRRLFWIIPLVFALCGLLHYGELIGIPCIIYPHCYFGLTRHTLIRMLFLIPIIYSSFLFRKKGALIAIFVALAIMLPRAILFSSVPRDAIMEVEGILGVGVLASWGIWTRAAEKDRTDLALAELQSAHRVLQHYAQSARKNEKRQTIINTISSMLGESLELESILRKAIHLVSELMEVEVALIFSLDVEKPELKLVAYEGVSDEFAQAIDKIGVGEGVYGEVARTCQPMVVDNTPDDPRFTLSAVIEMGIQTQLIVPMMLKDRIRGVLCVAMRRPRRFSVEDMELLTAMGTQIATAIENALLYEKEHLLAQRLAISEKNYRRLFENANDAIWVHDLAGSITAVNEAAAILVGYSTEELLTMNVKRFLSEESLNLAGQIRRKLLQNEAIEQPYEQRLIKKDETEATLKLTTSLVTEDGNPVGFQHIARDVTEERRMQDSLRYHLSQITKAQEEERKRISRDLHDDSSQALYALSRQVDNFTRDNADLAADTASFLKKLRQQLNNTLEGIRRFAQELRPPMLDDLGLLATLRWELGELEGRSGMKADLVVVGSERRFSTEVELIIFRILQEALRNVEKHAQASKVGVNIEFGEGKTKVSISDNGKGFDLEGSLAELPRAGKLGLTGMEERVRLLSGSMKIESELGKGTKVTVELPA